jgi:hypothetical protein
MGEAFLVDKPTGLALRALNYTPEIERLRSRRGADATSLSSLTSAIGPAYGAVFVRLDCEREHGIELITQSDMFAAEPEGRIIRRDSMAHPDRHLVRRWQVLIAGAGTLGENELYGRAIIADARLEGRYVGPHAMVLTFKEPESDQSLFTYAFLLTRVGLRAIRATSFGTKILGLRKDLLGDLPVPLAPPSVSRRVADLIRRCVDQRELYLRELEAARRVIEDLPDMRQAQQMCSERTARAVLWRAELPTISAWTYASTAGALESLQSKWSGRLGDILEEGGLFNGPRFARIPCAAPYGVEFMSQRDAFLIRPIPRRIAHPGFDNRLLFAPEGTTMVGGHGTLGEGEIFGRAMFIHGRFARTAFTQDLLRVLPEADHRSVVYAFLTTHVGMRLLRSTAVGTKILSMRLDLLRRLPYPQLDPLEKRRVEDHIAASVQARDSADQAESEAIRIVEQEVLPSWLA